MVTLAIRNAITLAVETGKAAASWPVFSRTSFAMVRHLHRQGIRPQTVIDVGANRGQFSVAACEIMRPRMVHAFEPLPDVGQRLTAAVARYPQVVVHRCALGAAPGRATLNVNSHSQSSSLLPLAERHQRAFPDARAQRTATIDVKTLDTVLPAELARPTLLKVDTQGYEAEVLEGAKNALDGIDWIVAELSFTPMYAGEALFNEMQQRLMDLGYRFERPVGSLRDPHTGEYLQIDALFVREVEMDRQPGAGT